MSQENYLPLFPLNIVVFPGERFNLHIFEPRYKELIKDCLQGNLKFGIPAYINNELAYGTEISLISIEKTYPDGKMDIKTQGNRVFKVQRFDNPMPGKLYAGGEIVFLNQDEEIDQKLQEELIELVKSLFSTLNIVHSVEVAPDLRSWDVAHKVGLAQEQEYALLQITSENMRIKFLIDHLIQAIPVIREMERSKSLIQMNGHFKNFDPLNF